MKLLQFILLGLCLTIIGGVSAQEQEPTPFSPIIPFGNAGLGVPSPYTIAEVGLSTGTSEWENSGWSGKDIQVGVLDRGFGLIDEFESHFAVTVTRAPGFNPADYTDDALHHGTQVLETIHSIAPDVTLYACAYDSLVKFSQCVDWMIRAGVDIINHSAGVPVLPLDGTNAWAREVDRAAREGILWVNAAGNYGQGYYSDLLTDRNTDKLHEFDRVTDENNQALGVEIGAETSNGVVMLSWESPDDRRPNEIDLDLRIIDLATGVQIAESFTPQFGSATQDALEYTAFTADRPYAIQVIDTNGDAVGTDFVLFIAFAQIPMSRVQQSVVAPGDSENSLTVGALQGISIAPYSSRGPLVGGRIAIDLVAPGEVMLRTGDFIGTSAAAAVVSGSAALVWEAFPNFDAEDVRGYLENNARDDNENTGVDTTYGQGILNLPLPDNPQEATPIVEVTATPRAIPTTAPVNISPQQQSDEFLYYEDFEDGFVDGASVSDGLELIDDGTGNRVLAAGRRQNNQVWLLNSPNWSNYVLEFQFQLTEYVDYTDFITVGIGGDDNSGCPSYTLWIAYDYINFFRRSAGCTKANIFGEGDFNPRLNKWYTVRLEVRDNPDSIRLYIDDEPYYQAIDDTLGKGNIGIGTFRFGEVYFDNIRVWSITE